MKEYVYTVNYVPNYNLDVTFSMLKLTKIIQSYTQTLLSYSDISYFRAWLIGRFKNIANQNLNLLFP